MSDVVDCLMQSSFQQMKELVVITLAAHYKFDAQEALALLKLSGAKVQETVAETVEENVVVIAYEEADLVASLLKNDAKEEEEISDEADLFATLLETAALEEEKELAKAAKTQAKELAKAAKTQEKELAKAEKMRERELAKAAKTQEKLSKKQGNAANELLRLRKEQENALNMMSE